MSNQRYWQIFIALAAGVSGPVTTASQAYAQDGAQQCAAAYEEAQRHRAKGSFLEANRAAQACSQVECNTLIVQECIKLFEQIQADTPSVVFSARNGAGQELVDVKVQIDGQAVADRLDGRPIELNPGMHTFRFESEGLPPLEMKQTARVGDRNRLLEIVLGSVVPPQADSKTSGERGGTALPPAAPPTKPGIPIPSFVLGGVGLVGLGAFGYLRLSGTSDYNELGKTCSPYCDPAETDKIHTKFQMSYVALGVGVAGLGGAALFYVLTRNKQGAPENEVAVLPTYGGARAQWQANF